LRNRIEENLQTPHTMVFGGERGKGVDNLNI